MDVYVIDFGGRGHGSGQKAWITKNGEKSKPLTFKEVLNLPNTLPKGCKLICEKAHLGVPKEQSRSQPFSASVLLDLYRRLLAAGIIFRLFPEKQTPIAIAKYSPNGKKSDELDPISIYLYLQDPNTKLHLQNPPKYFESKVEAAIRVVKREYKNKVEEYWIVKKDLNRTLNVGRKDRYDHGGERGDILTKLIVDHLDELYSRLLDVFDADYLSRILKLDVYKVGECRGQLKIKGKDDWSFSMNALYTLLAVLIDEEGNLRIRQTTGRWPSLKHILRYILCFSPNHLKGGCARSNLIYHIFRNYILSLSKYRDDVYFKGQTDRSQKYKSSFTNKEHEVFSEEFSKFRKLIKTIITIFQDILLRDNNYTMNLESELVMC